MAEKQSDSKYAVKVRSGNRMYGPCGYGPYTPGSEEATRRQIEDVKYWVERIRHRSQDKSRAVTLEDIRAERDQAKGKAA